MIGARSPINGQIEIGVGNETVPDGEYGLHCEKYVCLEDVKNVLDKVLPYFLNDMLVEYLYKQIDNCKAQNVCTIHLNLSEKEKEMSRKFEKSLNL